MFNTITFKKLAVFGFAFKKNTTDTRESAAITLINSFVNERAYVHVYDPKVQAPQIESDMLTVISKPQFDKHVKVFTSAYEAAEDADAVIILTEWDEFKTLDYASIFKSMRKPAYIFDGRLILDVGKLQDIGFNVEVIGTQGRF